MPWPNINSWTSRPDNTAEPKVSPRATCPPCPPTLATWWMTAGCTLSRPLGPALGRRSFMLSLDDQAYKPLCRRYTEKSTRRWWGAVRGGTGRSLRPCVPKSSPWKSLSTGGGKREHGLAKETKIEEDEVRGKDMNSISIDTNAAPVVERDHFISTTSGSRKICHHFPTNCINCIVKKSP